MRRFWVGWRGSRWVMECWGGTGRVKQGGRGSGGDRKGRGVRERVGVKRGELGWDGAGG